MGTGASLPIRPALSWSWPGAAGQCSRSSRVAVAIASGSGSEGMSTITTAKMTIPLSRPFVSKEEEGAVLEVLRSGWVSQGPRVAEFERRFAEYVGAAHAIAVSSCTTALHLALLAAGVQQGDEVICPSLSFIATANAIAYLGATPVFADIDRSTYNLNPESF